jgi:hypothetical protein
VGVSRRSVIVGKCAETGEQSQGALEEDLLAQTECFSLSSGIFDGIICRFARVWKFSNHPSLRHLKVANNLQGITSLEIEANHAVAVTVLNTFSNWNLTINNFNNKTIKVKNSFREEVNG